MADRSTLQSTQQKDYEKSEFGRALALAYSVKINEVKSEVASNISSRLICISLGGLTMM